MTRTKVLWPVVCGAGLFFLLVYWRGFPPMHAGIVALAAAALVYWTLRAADNLKRLR